MILKIDRVGVKSARRKVINEWKTILLEKKNAMEDFIVLTVQRGFHRLFKYYIFENR